MKAKLARMLEIASGHGRFTRLCRDADGHAYKRLDDEIWVDLGPCGHDHAKVDWSCCCGKKDCRA